LLPGVMTSLLNAGANPCASHIDSYGSHTPITYAISFYTPASKAMKKIMLQSLSILVKAGANINGSCLHKERTPLWYAIQRTREESQSVSLVETMLKLGADPTIKDPQGRDALEMAIQCERHCIIPLLTSSTSQLNRVLHQMQTPKHTLIMERFISRLKNNKEFFQCTLPGFKYEYENTLTLSWGTDGWVAISTDGYKQQETMYIIGPNNQKMQHFIERRIYPSTPLTDYWERMLTRLKPNES
jgi:hypothetical protein